MHCSAHDSAQWCTDLCGTERGLGALRRSVAQAPRRSAFHDEEVRGMQARTRPQRAAARRPRRKPPHLLNLEPLPVAAAAAAAADHVQAQDRCATRVGAAALALWQQRLALQAPPPCQWTGTVQWGEPQFRLFHDPRTLTSIRLFGGLFRALRDYLVRENMQAAQLDWGMVDIDDPAPAVITRGAVHTEHGLYATLLWGGEFSVPHPRSAVASIEPGSAHVFARLLLDRGGGQPPLLLLGFSRESAQQQTDEQRLLEDELQMTWAQVEALGEVVPPGRQAMGRVINIKSKTIQLRMPNSFVSAAFPGADADLTAELPVCVAVWDSTEPTFPLLCVPGILKNSSGWWFSVNKGKDRKGGVLHWLRGVMDTHRVVDEAQVVLMAPLLHDMRCVCLRLECHVSAAGRASRPIV